MLMVTVTDPIDADALRIRHEFLEMPALWLTVAQAARLLEIRSDRAAATLEALEEDGFLMRTSNGAYRRARPLTA
jgi:predicted transcriptional regulator of viral defense system